MLALLSNTHLLPDSCTMLYYIYCTKLLHFHSRTVHLDIIKVLSPTDSQENCFKKSIKVYIKTAQTCFGVITIIRERTI
jgi:hypothetical protein